MSQRRTVRSPTENLVKRNILRYNVTRFQITEYLIKMIKVYSSYFIINIFVILIYDKVFSLMTVDDDKEILT